MKVSSFKKEVKLAPAISYKNNHKAEDFDIDINADKAKVNNNDLAWAEKQYLTPNQFWKHFLQIWLFYQSKMHLYLNLEG